MMKQQKLILQDKSQACCCKLQVNKRPQVKQTKYNVQQDFAAGSLPSCPLPFSVSSTARAQSTTSHRAVHSPAPHSPHEDWGLDFQFKYKCLRWPSGTTHTWSCLPRPGLASGYQGVIQMMCQLLTAPLENTHSWQLNRIFFFWSWPTSNCIHYIKLWLLIFRKNVLYKTCTNKSNSWFLRH